MNDWQFLEAYNNLNDTYKAKVVVVMLTTSLNKEDLKTPMRIRKLKTL